MIEWWEEHRGWILVRCSKHGRLARVDCSRSVHMLATPWDVASVELHERWETAWDETFETPAFDGCNVTIEPEAGLDDSDLLDVKQMMIVYEGGTGHWWSHGFWPSELDRSR